MENITSNNTKVNEKSPMTPQQQEFYNIMLDALLGRDYGPSNFLEDSIEWAHRLMKISVIFLNIYIYYFIYNFSFNENFLLIFFFFGFFFALYNFAYYNVLSGLDSLSLELYIQFYRLIKTAKAQLVKLRDRLKEFKTMNRGLFLTYRNFVYLHVSTINTLESLSEFLYSSLINSLINKLNDFQFQAIKHSLDFRTQKNLFKYSRESVSSVQLGAGGLDSIKVNVLKKGGKSVFDKGV